MRLAIATLFAAASFATITASSRPTAESPCAASEDYQRLHFWIGDWEILDSAGAHYANQRVREAVDGCAITAEWEGRSGDKGLNLSSFDRSTGDWKQVYVSNQVPRPLGVQLRRSDPTYHGPGVRFIALLDPPATQLKRSRITLAPLGDHALQLFEQSNDGGKTWEVNFRAEHRRRE